MELNICSKMEYFRKKYREPNIDIMPQSTAVYKELLMAKDKASHN